MAKVVESFRDRVIKRMVYVGLTQGEMVARLGVKRGDISKLASA